MAKLFANSGDPDQMLHSAASDLGPHCLPLTLLRVSHYNGLNNRIFQRRDPLEILNKSKPENSTSVSLTLVLLNPICPAFANSVDPDQLASEEAN